MNREEAEYAWIDAVPEDPYGFCPCGCGRKMRHIIKDGETEATKHYEKFIEQKLREEPRQ